MKAFQEYFVFTFFVLFNVRKLKIVKVCSFNVSYQYRSNQDNVLLYATKRLEKFLSRRVKTAGKNWKLSYQPGKH